ncbi:MAG: hypothetical protein IPP77_08555 [Bacteroidetes bacterium]|nr:hypothetical protein [Bacteroidota bacterium]
MYAYSVPCLVLLLWSFSAHSENAYSLSNALQKKLVTVEIRGDSPDTSLRDYSSHYGPSMAMKISNKSGIALQINLDYGYKIVPADSSYQTMIVTQTATIHLPAGQKKNSQLYAMCTEANDHGPSPLAPFSMGPRATGSLLQLSELINRKNYQSDAAQQAVWCLTNDYDLHTIYSEDTLMMYHLRRFIAQAKKIPLSKIYESESSYAEPTYTTRTIYSGSIGYSIASMRPVKVMIALFDEDNHMKTIYVNNELQREGIYNYDYRVSSEEMNHKKHYLRMFRDGKMEEEVAIIPRE